MVHSAIHHDGHSGKAVGRRRPAGPRHVGGRWVGVALAGAAGGHLPHEMAAAARLNRTVAHLLVSPAAAHSSPQRPGDEARGAGPTSPFAGNHFSPRAGGGLAPHLDSPQVVLPAELTAAAPPLLLNDIDMQRFLVDGFCAIPVDCGSVPLHEEVCSRLNAVLAAEGNPTNNLLARVPAVQQVLDHPAVRGALQSLLGERSVLGPHRYVHTTQPGSGDGGFHKDCYGAGAWGCDHMLRHPRSQMLMGLYYPHDVTPADGPTCIIPQRSAYEGISHASPDQTTEQELPLVCSAGTIVFTPFDTWHRPSANNGAGRRHLLKFHFHRYAQPTAPSWNGVGEAWLLPSPLQRSAQLSAATAQADEILAKSTYEWLCGRGASAGGAGELLRVGELEDLGRELRSDDEATRLHAGYALGRSAARTAGAVAVLAAALREQVGEVAKDIVWDDHDFIEAARPPANLHGTNPTSVSAAQGLAAAGSSGMEALVRILADATSEWLLRVYVLDSLGLSGASAEVTADASVMLEGAMLRQLADEVRPSVALPGGLCRVDLPVAS